ncbi:hypothetical protein [Streptomyces sp. NPDC056387]|uniref:hypothetical protein n=1 Tax=Streptomyces sp. NPDC056387 TaxID=3345803 RepID=UPI0035D5CC9B
MAVVPRDRTALHPVPRDRTALHPVPRDRTALHPVPLGRTALHPVPLGPALLPERTVILLRRGAPREGVRGRRHPRRRRARPRARRWPGAWATVSP